MPNLKCPWTGQGNATNQLVMTAIAGLQTLLSCMTMIAIAMCTLDVTGSAQLVDLGFARFSESRNLS
jgi:hypothetical protein